MHHYILYLLRLYVIVVIFLAIGSSAKATTIDPLIWQQLVLDSEFVGIVECEVAGGIVAKYRVVESWKGAPVGTTITMRIAVNFWGPQYPITLVGEKYLVTAFKSYAPTRIMSTTSGSPVPIWWRNIPAEYRLPLWQGRVRLPLSQDKEPLYEIGSRHPDLSSFKKDVSELLALIPEQREIRLLQALSEKYLFSFLGAEKLDKEQKAFVKVLETSKIKIEKSSTVNEIVSEIFRIMKSHKDFKYSCQAVLEQGGGSVTLNILQNLAPKDWSLGADDKQETIAAIKQRIGINFGEKETYTRTEDEQQPTEQKINELREVLLNNPSSPKFGEAITLLTKYDPASVAAYLVKRVSAEKDWRDKNDGYAIGSYFARRCGKERKTHLQTLLKAQDPYVRVAGAVYLTFEDSDLGMARLKELMNLPGDPGAWAALSLARRGSKTAMIRALEVLSDPGEVGFVYNAPHEQLQSNLIILLSNSAAISGLPQPSPPDERLASFDKSIIKQHQEKVYKYYVDWWKKNEGKIQLHDPWMSILEQQKID